MREKNKKGNRAILFIVIGIFTLISFGVFHFFFIRKPVYYETETIGYDEIMIKINYGKPDEVYLFQYTKETPLVEELLPIWQLYPNLKENDTVQFKVLKWDLWYRGYREVWLDKKNGKWVVFHDRRVARGVKF